LPDVFELLNYLRITFRLIAFFAHLLARAFECKATLLYQIVNSLEGLDIGSREKPVAFFIFCNIKYTRRLK